MTLPMHCTLPAPAPPRRDAARPPTSVFVHPSVHGLGYTIPKEDASTDCLGGTDFRGWQRFYDGVSKASSQGTVTTRTLAMHHS